MPGVGYALLYAGALLGAVDLGGVETAFETLVESKGLKDLNDFCADTAGDIDIKPLYVDGYLDEITNACRWRCVEGVLSGDFSYIEILISEERVVPQIREYMFAPSAGAYRVERKKSGDPSCVLFDQMVSKFRASGRKEKKKYHKMTEEYCVGIKSIEQFKSSFGLRSRAVSTKYVDHYRLTTVSVEIYNLQTKDAYAKRNAISIRTPRQVRRPHISCGKSKQWMQLEEFILPKAQQ